MSAAAPLLSPDWYRVASLRPRLRSGVRVTRQTVRGDAWHVLSDPLSGRHHRFNDIAYRLLGSCDGRSTLDAIWAARVDAEGEQAPTQAETLQILSQAFAANLFVGDVAPDARAVLKAQRRRAGQRRRAQINPLAFRLPLWDPDAFLARVLPCCAWLGSRAARAALALLLLAGLLLLLPNADALATTARDQLASGRMLLVMWLVYPLLKALHELAHGLAVKRHGGEVHEAGITLMLLTPVPYVDASASAAFADKRARAGVALAGIAVEAALAALALPLWLLLEPGLARDIAFAVVFTGLVSTLLVNGNPLLRFDGYYALCDLAELPNLASRSLRWWSWQLKRRLLGLHHLRFGGLARGEAKWLAAYAPLSALNRNALLLLFALALADWNAAAGLAVLALALWSIFKPAWSALRWLAGSPEAEGARLRGGALLGAATAALVLLAVGLTLPQRTHAPGVVWLPDDALVRLGTDGFVDELLVADGAIVAAGTPIARLTNDALQARLADAEAELTRLRVEHAQAYAVDAARAAAAEDALNRQLAEHARLAARIDALTVRAGVAGRVVIDARHRIAGRWLPQGELVAYVLPPEAALVRALVANADIDLVRERPGVVSVQLAHADAPLAAQPAGAVPRASNALPAPALGEAAGGSIALDASDPSGRTAREARFQVDVRLAAGADARVGARALVTFEHGRASLAELAARQLRQSFLRHFER